MAMEALEKLATEMTDRIAELEKENGSLKAQLATANEALTKKAAEDNAPKNVVPEDIADATVKALVKAGALLDSQVDESKRVFMTDATAPHRVLMRILDAQDQAKTASARANDNFDVNGGRIADTQPVKNKPYEDDCLDRMEAILGMK